MAVADPSRRRAGRPGPRRRPSRRDQRTGPGRRPRPSRRHRRPHPVPDRRPRPSPDGPVVVPSPRHRRRHTPRVPDRDHRADERLPGPHRRARRPARPAPGGYRPRLGARRSAEPGGVAETGRLHRRLAGTIRPPRPRRSDRAGAGRGRPRPGRGLVPGPGRPRSRRRTRRPRHARREAAVPARHLPHRNRLGTSVRQRPTPPGPRRRPRRPPGRATRRGRSRRHPASTTRHCALPNPTRLPTPSAPNSPSPRSTHRAR
jgi:hypothetical protein